MAGIPIVARPSPARLPEVGMGKPPSRYCSVLSPEPDDPLPKPELPEEPPEVRPEDEPELLPLPLELPGESADDSPVSGLRSLHPFSQARRAPELGERARYEKSSVLLHATPTHIGTDSANTRCDMLAVVHGSPAPSIRLGSKISVHKGGSIQLTDANVVRFPVTVDVFELDKLCERPDAFGNVLLRS
ncbi:MAG: hypothetical protein Q9184_003455 [Pyrenodesmia sp. 2 TL-2023]